MMAGGGDKVSEQARAGLSTIDKPALDAKILDLPEIIEVEKSLNNTIVLNEQITENTHE